MAKSLSLPSLPFISPSSITTHLSQLPKISCSSISIQSQSAKDELLTLISDQERGLKTQKNPRKLASIVKSIDALASLGRNSVTTDDSLSATWRLLWTTEKEQLFIIEKAYLFGTQAGDVLQVIDVEKKSLNNVITFPPHGVFFVRSNIEVASSQRVNFKYVLSACASLVWMNCFLNSMVVSWSNQISNLVHNVDFRGYLVSNLKSVGELSSSVRGFIEDCFILRDKCEPTWF